MLLPVLVIGLLFGVAVKVAPKIDSEPKKEWAAMSQEEQEAELRWIAYQNQRANELSRNEFERIPIQK